MGFGFRKKGGNRCLWRVSLTVVSEGGEGIVREAVGMDSGVLFMLLLVTLMSMMCTL